MAMILAMLSDPAMRLRVQGALRPGPAACAPTLCHPADWSETHARARTSPVDLAVFDPFHDSRFDASECAAFARAFPSVPLVAYGQFRAWPASCVVTLVQAGITRTVTWGLDDSPALLRALLLDACGQGASAALDDIVRACIPDEFHELVRFAWGRAGDPPAPAAAARVCHCHPKTLRDHLRRAGLPTTERLLIWVRLLRAAVLLRDSGHSVDSAAALTGFATGASLSKQLRRYAQAAPQRLRAADGLAFLLDAFRRAGHAGAMG